MLQLCRTNARKIALVESWRSSDGADPGKNLERAWMTNFSQPPSTLRLRHPSNEPRKMKTCWRRYVSCEVKSSAKTLLIRRVSLVQMLLNSFGLECTAGAPCGLTMAYHFVLLQIPSPIHRCWSRQHWGLTFRPVARSTH